MPNFWGCRCCGRALIASTNTLGGVSIRSLETGVIKWSVSTSDTSLLSVRFINKSTVVAIGAEKRHIIENGSITSSVTDSGSRSTSTGRYALATQGARIVTSAYLANGEAYYLDPPYSTVNPIQLRHGGTTPVNGIYEVAIDSEGSMYFGVVPAVGHTESLWKTDDTGNVLWSIDAGGDVQNVAIDESDNLFISIRDSGGNYSIKKYDTDGTEVFSVSGRLVQRTMVIPPGVDVFYGQAVVSGSLVVRTYAKSDGSTVGTDYSGFWASDFNAFAIEKSSGDLIFGSTAGGGVNRIVPATDALVWPGESRAIREIDLRYF